MNKRVTVGLADFADPALLLIGDVSGLLALRDVFENQDLSGITNLLNLVGIQLDIHFAARDSYLEKSGTRITWFVSASDAKKFSRLIEGVANSEKPAHAYLDVSGNAGLEIVVSKSEYEPAAVFASVAGKE